MTLDQAIEGIRSVVDQMAQDVGHDALPEDRGGLQGLFVGRRQAVDSREDDALDRARDGFFLARLGAAQKLFEEQGVALGAGDRVLGEAIGGVDELPREL